MADAGAGELRDQAQQFADRLTASVHAIAQACEPFEVKAIQTSDGAERFAVMQEPDTGVPLTVAGDVLLTLKVQYMCAWDRARRFLAVDESKVKVYAGGQAQGEPLFRYEYVRHPRKDHPGAHIQIHAHRDGITHVMSKAGGSTKRARRRAGSDSVPRMSELHFPVGGPRYRPCLEDVLEMLVCELGVDCDSAGREALAIGREEWRRQQTRTVVRDAPDEAADALRLLGYRVRSPRRGKRPGDNITRLREH